MKIICSAILKFDKKCLLSEEYKLSNFQRNWIKDGLVTANKKLEAGFSYFIPGMHRESCHKG